LLSCAGEIQFSIINDSLLEKLRRSAADNALFETASRAALNYMRSVARRPVFPPPAAIAQLKIFDEPLPGRPGDPAAMLALLHDHGSPGTVAQTGGRYFGFVNGGALPAALAVKWLADGPTDPDFRKRP
jgi:hypothetical protein